MAQILVSFSSENIIKRINMQLNIESAFLSLAGGTADVTADVLLDDFLKLFNYRTEDLSTTIGKLAGLMEAMDPLGPKLIIIIGK